MKATIDKAGRVVIPRELRDRVGLGAGEVDIIVDGTGLRIELETSRHLTRKSGRLVVAAGGTSVDDELIDELRHADQK